MRDEIDQVLDDMFGGPRKIEGQPNPMNLGVTEPPPPGPVSDSLALLRGGEPEEAKPPELPKIDMVDEAVAGVLRQKVIDAEDKKREASVLQWTAQNVGEPGRAAEVRKYSAALPNMPLPEIEKNLESIRRKFKADSFDWEQLLETHPVFTKMVGDPALAPMVIDDAGTLTGLESVLTGKWEYQVSGEIYDEKRNIKVPLREFRLVTPPAWAAAVRDAFTGDMDLMWHQTQRLFGVDPILPDINPLTGRRYGLMSENEEKIAKEEYYQYLREHSTGERNYMGIIENSPTGKAKKVIGNMFLFPFKTAPMIVGSVASGGIGGATGILGGVAGLAEGVAAREAIGFAGMATFNALYTAPGMYDRLSRATNEKGEQMPEGAARIATIVGAPLVGWIMSKGLSNTITGSVEKAVERVGVSTLQRAMADQTLLRAFGEWGALTGTHVMEGAAGFAMQAMVDSSIEQLARSWALGQPASLELLRESAWESFKQGLIDMPVLASWRPGNRFLHEVGQMRRAVQTRARVRIMSDAAEAAKHPEVVEEMGRRTAAQPGAVDRAYLDREAFDSVARKLGRDPREVAAEVFGDEGVAYDRAVTQHEADLAVPIDRYLDKVARSSRLGRMLEDEVRFDPSDYSFAKVVREVERWAKLADEAAKAPIDKMPDEDRGIYDAELDKAKKGIPSTYGDSAEHMADAHARTVLSIVRSFKEMTKAHHPDTTLTEWYAKTFGPVGIFKMSIKPGVDKFFVGQIVQNDKGVPVRITLISTKNFVLFESLDGKMTGGARIEDMRAMNKAEIVVGPEVELSPSWKRELAEPRKSTATGSQESDWAGMSFPDDARFKTKGAPAWTKVTAEERQINLNAGKGNTLLERSADGVFEIHKSVEAGKPGFKLTKNGHTLSSLFSTIEDAKASAQRLNWEPLPTRHMIALRSERANKGHDTILAHEFAHTFMRVLKDLWAAKEPGMVELYEETTKAMGYKDGVDRENDFRVIREERFAHAFEQFLVKGESPSIYLAPVFAKFMQWGAKLARERGYDDPLETFRRQWARRFPEGHPHRAIIVGAEMGPASALAVEVPDAAKRDWRRANKWYHDNPITWKGEEKEARAWLDENKTTPTAGFTQPIMLPVEHLINLPGRKDEHLRISSNSQSRERIDTLKASMLAKGYEQDAPIMVRVLHDGRVVIHEGNHRVRAAKEAGIREIPAEVDYEGGSEMLPRVWDPYDITHPETLYGPTSGGAGGGKPVDPLNEALSKLFTKVLTSVDEIEWAKRVTGASEAFPEAAKNMGPEDRAKYEADVKKAQENALNLLVRIITERSRKENSQFFKEERKRIADGVRMGMRHEPLYAAIEFFRTGQHWDPNVKELLTAPNGKPYRFFTENLIERFGKEQGQRYIDLLRSIDRKAVTTDKEMGLEVDLLAEYLGFGVPDGWGSEPMKLANAVERMMAAFTTALPFEEAVARRTEARLRTLYQSDLIDAPEVLHQKVLDMVIDEKMAQKVVREMNALARDLDADRVQRSKNIDPERMMALARRLINMKALRDIRPEQYARAIGTATAKARDAAKGGEMYKAWDNSEGALINVYMYKAAREMEVKIEKAWRKLSEDSVTESWRSKLGKGDPRYRDFHDAILEVIGLRQELAPEVASKINPKTFDDFFAAVKENGQENQVDGWNVDLIKEMLGGQKSWRDLTPSEALNIHNAIINIAHIAETMREIKSKDAKAKLDEAAEALKADLETRPFQGKAPADMALISALREPGKKLESLLANTETFRSIIDLMGPAAKKYLWDPYLEARWQKHLLQKLVTEKFEEIYQSMPDEIRAKAFEELHDIDKFLKIPEDINLAGPRSRSWLWMVMLNMGNAGNRQRMLSGMGWHLDQVIKAAEKYLSPVEMNFIQGVWDIMDRELWPRVVAKEEKRTGLKPEEVVAVPLRLKFVDPVSGLVVDHEFRGGYFPAKYDLRAGQRAIDSAIERTSEGPVRMRPGTAKSYVKSRAENYSDIVNLEWNVLPSHLAEVIHDLAYDEWVRDANKLIFNKKHKIPDTMYQRMGEEFAKQPRAFLESVAWEQTDPVSAHMARVLGILDAGRSRVVYSALGYNIPVMLADFLHPIAVAAFGQIKAVDMSAAFVRAMPWSYREMRDFAEASSKEINVRAAHMNAKMWETIQVAKRAGRPTAFSRPLDAIRRNAFVFLDTSDKIVSTIIWTAKYREMIRSVSHEEAVAAADDTLNRSMPAHVQAEMAGMLRDKKTIGSLLLFQGYYSTLFQLGLPNVRRARQAWADAGSEGYAQALGVSAVAAMRIAAGLGVASVLGDYVMGHGKEKDETWGEWWARKSLVAPFTTVPFGSMIAEPAVDVLVSGKVRQISVRNAPIFAVGQQVFGTLGRLASDRRTDEQKFWDLVETAAFMGRLPARQPRRTGEYLTNWATGEVDPDGILDVASGLTYGKRKKQAANPIADFGDLTGW